jgi:tRNA dimethylallyltransferase
MMPSPKYLIALVGPTAVGKTETAIRLAQYFRTEIVSADSRQFYREMSIGTAKPTPTELAQAPHYFINTHSICEEYNVGQYETEALRILSKIFRQKNTAILTGGSGLYIKAICEGIDEMPENNPEIRALLTQRLENEGLTILTEDLKKLDQAYYQIADKSNPQRILRALEVCLSTGKPYSDFRKATQVHRPFEIIKIGLTRPREELYARIESRTDKMIEDGLVEEVKQLLPFREHNALQTVGYQEIFGFLDGVYDWEEAVRLLKRNSRRYAKRQMTWFNKDRNIHWFTAGSEDKIIAFLDNLIQS